MAAIYLAKAIGDSFRFRRFVTVGSREDELDLFLSVSDCERLKG